ncbi:MAG: spermidine synthase [Sulfurovaceae bacterium]|nr:spermidine synthase [Sulfurovaceae bacterium]
MQQKNNSLYEMLIHIPVCTHANPINIVIISDKKELADEIAKYKEIHTEQFSSNEAIAKLTDIGENSLDVIIVDDKNMLSDPLFCGIAKRALTSKGVMSIKASSLTQDNAAATSELKALGEDFRIVMPYGFIDKDDNYSYAYLASNFYHPTADINLQRADLTDGFLYYNSDIAIASFVMPTYIRKQYLGLIKS